MYDLLNFAGQLVFLGGFLLFLRVCYELWRDEHETPQQKDAREKREFEKRRAQDLAPRYRVGDGVETSFFEKVIVAVVMVAFFVGLFFLWEALGGAGNLWDWKSM